MPVTALPTPPNTGDPDTLNARSNAFFGAMPQFAAELNGLAPIGSITVTLAHDTASGAIAAPNNGGLVVVSCVRASDGGGSAGNSGLLVYDVSSGSLSVTKLSGGATLAGASGDLTGTTGTQGNLTVSARAVGQIEVENRTGQTRVVRVVFI